MEPIVYKYESWEGYNIDFVLEPFEGEFTVSALSFAKACGYTVSEPIHRKAYGGYTNKASVKQNIKQMRVLYDIDLEHIEGASRVQRVRELARWCYLMIPVVSDLHEARTELEHLRAVVRDACDLIEREKRMKPVVYRHDLLEGGDTD